MRYEPISLNVDYQNANAKQDGSRPILWAYLLDCSPEMPSVQTRPAVIICPGGGYFFKSDRESEPIAMRFLAEGIHAFVLQYSVAPSRYPSAVLELAAAVRLVRENADQFHLYPDQIYIAGFSAGGHLCATLGTLWNEPIFQLGLHSDHPRSWRPDGMILSYPVITMGQFTHQGSRDCLLGEDVTQEKIDALSLETRVNRDTPPAFLWHTCEDDAVPVENTLLFALALRKNGIPLELHLYEKGIHGLSLCNDVTAQNRLLLAPDNANWMEMAIRWINRRR